MTFGSAKQTKKEYAEKPFSLYDFKKSGRQFTVEEDIQITQKPRTGKKEGISKYGSNAGKPYTIDVAKIRVSDGIFEKDMLLDEKEWITLCAALPEPLLGLKGVVLAYDNDALTYVGVSPESDKIMPDMNENFPKANNPALNAPEVPVAPVAVRGGDINTCAEMLANAVKQNTELGITTTYSVLQKMADKIYPNRALDVIAVAKANGCISDHGAEGFRGH